LGIQTFISENRGAIAFALALILIATAAYFLTGSDRMGAGKTYGQLLLGSRFKVDSSEGVIDVYALAKNNALAKLPAKEGSSIQEADTLVLGSTEGEAMKEEKEFSSIGDQIPMLNINAAVGGVLEKTGTLIDMVHFLPESKFNSLNATEGIIFAKVAKDGSPKIFYKLPLGERLPGNLTFSEGSMRYYEIHKIAGKTFYPVIIGFDEAKMMRSEKLFSKPGDTLEGFFGNDVMIAGVLDKSNTTADMLHFIPLSEGSLN
jgi:hypothetical protein